MANPLWDYALRTYEIDGVAPACLVLQDRYGLDVNLLLYAAWLAQADQRLGEYHLAELEASVSAWRDRVVRPLRAVRRHLHDSAAARELCDGVKALELRAEREQLDAMFAFYRRTEALPRAIRPLRDNLATVAHQASPEESGWEPAIDTLAMLIPR